MKSKPPIGTAPFPSWHVLGEDQDRATRDTTPPNLPFGHVPRPRLIAMIEQPFRARITLIVAGAGYGKTILATELAKQIPSQVGWLSLSASDNDEHAFINDLRLALRPCLRRGRVTPLADLQDDHALLERDLADVGAGNCLILDNCEVLTNPACHQILNEVLVSLPEHCSIVLVSRTTPPIPLGKLRASGLVREIGMAHLRFLRTETAAFLGKLPVVAWEPDEALHIHQFTEGWAVGLYLVALAARTDAMPLRTDSERYPVLHQFVDEYVLQEIWAPLPESARAFLQATIELPSITVDFANRILGITDAQERMTDLLAAFPFISVQGTPQRWTWLHMIRDSVLRITDAAARRSPIADQHRAAVALMRADGAHREATDYALIGGDPEWIAESIRPWCEHLALRSDFEPLHALMERVPAAVLALHPDFPYWRAISQLGIARQASVLAWFPPIEHAWMQSGDPLLIGRALTCRSMIGWLRGNHADATVAADRAMAILPATAIVEQMYAATTKARLLFREGNDEQSAAAAKIAESHAAHLPLDEQWSWRTLAMDRANAYAMRGDLFSAVTKYRLIISELPESLHFLEGFYRCRLLSLAIEQDQMGVARSEWVHVERLLEGEWRFWHIWAIIARTRLLIAEGKIDEAEAWATARVKVLRRMPGKAQLVMQLARAWLHHGEYALVRSWLGDLESLDFAWIDAFGEIGHRQLEIDVDLAEGRYLAAAERARSLAMSAATLNKWSEWIVFVVRWALATSLRGETERAATILAPAVRRGDRGGVVRAFQVPGFDTSSLMEHARRITIAQDGDPAVTIGSSALTPRELQILHLVARGQSNHQIAQRLFISANTVRNHIVNICRRLDVKSRMAAVAKARDLDLIP